MGLLDVFRRNAPFLAAAVFTSACVGEAPTDEEGIDGDSASLNLTTNPSFESSLAGWVPVNASLSRVQLTGAPDGGYVAEVKRTSEGRFGIDDSPSTIASTSAGQSYTGTAYVRASSASSVGKRVVMLMRERNASGSIVRTGTALPVTLTNSFQRIALSVSAQGSGNNLDIYVYQESAVSGNAFYVDAITISQTGTTGGTDAGVDAGSPPDAGTPPPDAGTCSTAGLKAFPTAEGYGKLATGGRGGAVYEVTNLNDAGTGSFRACAEATGPRTCVFRVSGTIAVMTPIKLKSYLTVAGQTAPGGIALRLAPGATGTRPLMAVATTDIIIRHIRVRSGSVSTSNAGDGFLMDSAKRLIVDHSSFSWSSDENIDMYKDVSDVTIQWSISAEGLKPHSKGMLISYGSTPQKISLYRNLFHSNNDRNPDVHTTPTSCLDFINNVGSNPSSAFIEIWDNRGGSRINAVSNVFRRGPATNSACYAIRRDATGATGTPQIYFTNNMSEVPQVDPAAAPYLVSSPVCPFSTPVAPAADAYDSVVASVGAFPRDSVDSRFINEVKNHTGQLISDPATVGGWPTLTGPAAPTDSDHDGMPDAWEAAHGLSASNAADRNGDADCDGYTNLEEYLDELAETVTPP